MRDACELAMMHASPLDHAFGGRHMFQLAGCEDGGCPGLWLDGEQLLAQGVTVTDPQVLARTKPAAGEMLVALPQAMLAAAMAAALTKLLAS